MPTRQIRIDSRDWHVYPSGFLTQSVGDEFGLIFVTGKERSRGACHALHAGTHPRPRTVAGGARRSAAQGAVSPVAVERPRARSWLSSVTPVVISVVAQQQEHQAGHTASTPAFVDLQVHTTASDGALAPAVVVQAAHDAQLAAIAITDHDTVDGLDEATAAGEALGVRIVPGVELSTHFENEELHLLGLHIANRDAIRSALRELQAQRVVRAERIVAVLNAHGMPITMDAVLREAGDGAVGRPHVARAMLAGGWVREFREAFDKWIGFGRPAYMAKDRFDVADAIALVHRAGGIAVWAHPVNRPRSPASAS